MFNQHNNNEHLFQLLDEFHRMGIVDFATAVRRLKAVLSQLSPNLNQVAALIAFHKGTTRRGVAAPIIVLIVVCLKVL